MKARFYDIDYWYREMINMPIIIPQTYIDGWNAGRKQEPYDDTKPITWKCGYDDGRYNLLSSLL
jgi:hypothetical protein